MKPFTDTPGRCLCCGGRGGYPGRVGTNEVQLCARCEGTGLDPRRTDPWFVDNCLLAQIETTEECQ